MSILAVPASTDSFMDFLAADTNYGTAVAVSSHVVYAGGDKTSLRRSIGNFDVSALSGETINSAILRRYVSFVYAGVGARISRCTRPATWTEGGVTWNKYDGTNSWVSGGGDFDDVTPTKIDYTEPSGMGWHEIAGLKPFVEDAIDNRSNIVSLIVRLQDEEPESTGGISWRSVDSGSLIWELEINYGDADGSRRLIGQSV